MIQKEPRVFSGANDVFFVIILLVISLLAWLMFRSEAVRTVKGCKIVVLSDPIQNFTLTEPTQKPFRVQGKIGSALIELNSANEYRIASSSCPNHVCINYGWTGNGSIVCVPNGIVVTANSRESEFDAIAR